MACTQIQEEREGKKRKKSHFRPNHYTRVIHIGKGLQDEYWIQPHVLPEVGRAADTLTSVLNTPATF